MLNTSASLLRPSLIKGAEVDEGVEVDKGAKVDEGAEVDEVSFFYFGTLVYFSTPEVEEREPEKRNDYTLPENEITILTIF